MQWLIGDSCLRAGKGLLSRTVAVKNMLWDYSAVRECIYVFIQTSLYCYIRTLHTFPAGSEQWGLNINTYINALYIRESHTALGPVASRAQRALAGQSVVSWSLRFCPHLHFSAGVCRSQCWVFVTAQSVVLRFLSTVPHHECKLVDVRPAIGFRQVREVSHHS